MHGQPNPFLLHCIYST